MFAAMADLLGSTWNWVSFESIDRSEINFSDLRILNMAVVENDHKVYTVQLNL